MANEKPRNDYRLKPLGQSDMERWYAFARKWCAVFAERKRTRDRCKHCFQMRDRECGRGWTKVPAKGCDGCAEMEKFYYEAKAFFLETESKETSPATEN